MRHTFTFKRDAYTVEAVIEAGVPATIARTLLATGPRAVPECPRLTAKGRQRAKRPTTFYIWGPDAESLLAEHDVTGAFLRHTVEDLHATQYPQGCRPKPDWCEACAARLGASA